MSRSDFACRFCGAVVGLVRASGVMHPVSGVEPTFIDLDGGTATLRCTGCGETIVYRGGRIEFARRGQDAVHEPAQSRQAV